MNPVGCKELVAMGRNIETPIKLALTPEKQIEEQGRLSNSDLALTLNDILRLLPGKRLVALTKWQGDLAIAKLFFQPGHWRRHVQREQAGLELLKDAGIATAQPLLCTETADGQGAVLISEYLSQAKSLEKLSRETETDEQFLAVVSRVVKTIGECHKQGIWQQDIHPDNFLLTHNKVFCIDGASVNKVATSGPLPESDCLQNIIVFFAQFPADKDRLLPELFTNYQQSRADTVVHIDWDLLREKVINARKTRLNNYQKKLFRSTTDHRCLSSITSFVVYKRAIQSEDLQRFIRDPDSFISAGQVIKPGNSSTVARINLDGKQFIVKRYNVKNIRHRLRRLFRPSRAHNSWLHGSLLQMLGIATATPYLCLEQRLLWWMRGKAYLLCEDIAGDTVAEQLQTQQAGEAQLLTPILDAYKNLFSLMQRYFISHGDMKASNFIFQANKLFVLDLDAMQRHKSPSRFNERFKKDLLRFRKNWIASPTIDCRTQKLVNEILNTLN